MTSPDPLALFADACDPGVLLSVYLGVITEATDAGFWDISLWDDPDSQWGTGIIPVDIAKWVRSFSSSRGFQAGQDVWNAGTLTVELDNTDGRFSPDNLEIGSPYVTERLSGIRPRCPISVTMTYGGIEYPVFAGRITDLIESNSEHGTKYNPCNREDPENLDRLGDATMTITATDEWGILGKQKRRPAVAPIGAGDTFSERISRLLAVASYSGPSPVLSDGIVTFQATTLEDEIIGEISKTVRSEGGVCYIDADGTFVARGRYDPLNDPRSTTPQIRFGDRTGDILWSGITIAPISDGRIVNHAVYTRVGGTDQEHTDWTSVALYGMCDDDEQPSDLLCETDSQVTGLAQWAVLVGAQPETRIETIEVKPRYDLALMAPLILDLKMRDLVSVTIRPPSTQHHILYRECFVSGVEHVVVENDWTVKISTSTATQYRRFAESRWDVGRWGSSPIDASAAKWFV